MLDIKEKDIENYTNIPLTDYIETIQQGYCEQCKKTFPKNTDSPFFIALNMVKLSKLKKNVQTVEDI